MTMAGSPTSPHHPPVAPPAVRDGAVALPNVPHVVTLSGARVVLWDTFKRRAGKLASDHAQALVALLVHGADRQREDVAAILANAACDKHNRRELAVAGAIPLLVRAITYAATDRMQYKTFIGKLSRALANLAWRHADNQLQIEASGGVDALVDILATGTTSDELEIQDEAATALSHLLDHREIARRVQDSRNKTVLEQLARDGGSDQQRAQAAWMLSKLSPHTVPAPEVTVDIPALVQLLLTHSDHGVRAASVLRRLSRDVAHKSAIVVAGGLAPLIRLLQHGKKESQRVDAAWTLGHLAWNAFSEAQIAKAGAIPPLVELLQTPNVREREGAVWALRHLSCTSDNRHRMGSLPQGIPSLVNSVRSAGSSCEREHALATLKNLACSSDNQTAIGAAGAIPLLVAVLTKGTATEMVEAAATLRNLVRDHLQNQSLVVRARGLRPLIELLSTGDEMQQIHAAATLANLASDIDLQDEIVAEGALPIALMLTESSDAALLEYVAQFVRNLIWRNDTIQTRIGASGVIPRVVAMLSHSDGLKKQAAAILRNLAWQHPTNQAHILETDAVAALLELLAVGTAGQREEAAGAIANLTWNNPSAQEQVASDNGLGPLAELTASRSGSNDKLQKQATLAIRHCVFNGHKKVQVAAPRVVPSFVRLLASGSNQQEQQATWAIANLACNPENKAEIVSSGAIPPLVAVLSSGSTSQRQYAASALANLACNHEHKMEILEAKGVAPLIDLVARGSDGQKKQAAWALRNLAWNCTEGQAAIAAANGIQVLVELVETGTDLQIEHAAAALANLACLDENQPHISLAGGIHALVQLVIRGSDGQKLQAAWALANLSMSPSNRATIVDAGGLAALQWIASSGTPDQQRGASAALARINDSTSDNSPTAPESHAMFRSPSDGSDGNDRAPLRDLLRVGSARTNVSPQPPHEIKIGRALYRSISSVPEIITLNPTAMVESSSTRSPPAQLNHPTSFSMRRTSERRPQLHHLPSVQEIDSSSSSRVIESSGWSAFDEQDAMNPPDSRMLQRARSANPPARVAVRMPSSPVEPMRSNQNRPRLSRPSTLGDLLDPHGGYSPPKDAELRRNIARVQSDMDMVLAKAQSQHRLSPVRDRENVPSNFPAMHRSPSSSVEYRAGRLVQRIEESSSSNQEGRGSRGELVMAGEETPRGMLQRRRSSHPAVAPSVDQPKHRNSAGGSSDNKFFGSMPLTEQSQSGNEEVFEYDEDSDIAFHTSAAHATPEMESKYPIISL